MGMVGVNNMKLRSRTSHDYAGILVRYANGAFTNYGGNLYRYGPGMKDYYFAMNATIALTAREVSIHYGHPKGIPQTGELPEPISMDLPDRDGTLRQWQHFVKVIKGKAAPYPDGYIGRRPIQIAYGAKVSTEQGSIVKVSEL